jgi:hypothetical protein
MMMTTCSILPAVVGASFAASPAPVSTVVAASPAASPPPVSTVAPSPVPASEAPPPDASPEPGGEASPDIDPSIPAASSSLVLPHPIALASETPTTNA